MGPAGGHPQPSGLSAIRERVLQASLPLERLGVDNPPLRHGVDGLDDLQSGSIPTDSYQISVDRVSEAENAVLMFNFLEGVHRRIPLRVSMMTVPEGTDIEVVSVRQGDDVSGYNQFSDEDRERIGQKLMEDGTGILDIEDSQERYQVKPSLTWNRGETNQLVVESVEIREVVGSANRD